MIFVLILIWFFFNFCSCFFTVITTYFNQISQNPILRLELWTINVLNIKIKKRKKLTRWVEADLFYPKMPGLSYTLISNKAIKSHTYLDFVRTVLKTKGKQHWNLWDFHKTIYWYLGIYKKILKMLRNKNFRRHFWRHFTNYFINKRWINVSNITIKQKKKNCT